MKVAAQDFKPIATERWTMLRRICDPVLPSYGFLIHVLTYILFFIIFTQRQFLCRQLRGLGFCLCFFA